ncbi:hypothetical protein PENTCL1PPCAC_4850, partial [Pristionchus entomophagus]
AMLDILVVLVLGALWALRWAKKRGIFPSFLLGSRLDGGGSSVCERVDADLTDDGVPYPSKVPSSLGILYTAETLSSQLRLVSFLLHCYRAGVRKVVIHGYRNPDELKSALESVLVDYGQDRIRIENHSGIGQKKEKAEKMEVDFTRVLILPACSGRKTMVEAARELCHSPSPVTTTAVAAALEGAMLDDLQAVVMVGATPTLAAFPPWPLRIAELIPVADLPRAKADFVRCLGVFGSRDIRQGK